MTIRFANDGVLDLDTIRIMGASIKGEGSIGYFGTGLKFAIATLLRTGHTIRLTVLGVEHHITTETKTIRGEEFQVVHLNGVALGYTTALGKDWEPWQAYRELSSNARDEADGITTDLALPRSYDTVIEVTGEGIEKAYRERATIFTEAQVLYDSSVVQIRKGDNKFMFYRGVRAAELQQRTVLTYNILSKLDLTEDRTIKHAYYAGHYIASTLANCSDTDILEAVLVPPEGSFESAISWEASDPGPAWFAAVGRLKNEKLLSDSAFKVWCAKQPHQGIESFTLENFEHDMLVEARRLCRVIDSSYKENPDLPVRFAVSLGSGVLGRCFRGQVFIAREAFNQGVEILAGTLLEEYLHLEHGFSDESRSFQNYLINQIVRMSKRLPRSHGLESPRADLPF